MILLRIQFAKLDETRFISHLDLMRTLSRAFRRSKVPVAFSQGFNPHHQVSMGPPLAVGITGTGEYMDVQLAEEMTPEEFLQQLKPQMPKGLEVVKAEQISSHVRSLMAEINLAVYMVRLKTSLEKEGIEHQLREFYKQKQILVVREKNNREVDLKPLIRDLKLIYIGNDPILQMRVQTGSQGNARPEEIMSALSEYAVAFNKVPLSWIHRQGLYVERNGRLLTPFEAARI